MTDKRKPASRESSLGIAELAVAIQNNTPVRRYDGADGLAVRLPAERDDIVSVGGMRPGRVYIVAPDEARRLVAVKGFVLVDLPSVPAPGPSEGGGPADDARRQDGSNTPRLED